VLKVITIVPETSLLVLLVGFCHGSISAVGSVGLGQRK